MSAVTAEIGARSKSPKELKSAASLKLAFRFALRELRGGLRGFYIFLACIALGVAAISGVNSVALSITGGIQSEGAAILGGDLSFTIIHRELSGEETAFLNGLGQVSRVGTLRAMARREDGSDQSLIEIKAVDGNYPLVGKFETRPESGRQNLAESPDNISVDPLLLDRLDIALGSPLKIGKQIFTVNSTIRNEPDRVGDNIGFGPKVLMSLDALQASGLVQPGSLIHWRYRIKLSDGSNSGLANAISEAKKRFPDVGWRIKSRANAAPALTRNIDRFSQFLTLVGLTALVVGGVGVANAVRAFLNTKRHVIASFKCLGAPANFVFQIYLIQILILATAGIAIGLIFGVLMPLVAKLLLAGIIPVGGGQAFYPGALGMAVLFGFLTALAFTLWPLGHARDVPATALFQEDTRGSSGRPAAIFVVSTILVVAALIGLAILQSGDKRVAAVFIAGIGFSFVLLRLVAVLIQFLARRAPQVRSTRLRLAIGNIHRPGALTASVVLSLGLGLALLVSLALIEGNMRNQITGSLPKKAPDFFFVDIQNSEIEDFKTFLARTQPGSTVQSVPMLRGRITGLKGVETSKLNITGDGAWVLRGDRGITYSATMPKNASLAEGEWWAEGYQGEPLVSFTAEEAGELGLKVGDQISINVLGRGISARIANLRNVEWESMSINFVMVFSPNTFAGAPHTLMATLRLKKDAAGSGEALSEAGQTARDARVLKSVTGKFPTVTTVRVRDALGTVNKLIGQLASAIRAAAAVALLSSVLVLGGALAAGNSARIHDAVVLKTLGATRNMLIGAFGLEYFILGLATAIFAVIAGGTASWFVISRVMGFNATFQVEVALATVIGALVLTVGFGLAGTWRVLGQKAAPILRNE